MNRLKGSFFGRLKVKRLGVKSFHLGLAGLVLLAGTPTKGETVALWLFDERVDSQPYSLLADAGPQNHPLILGDSGELAPGRFGNALRPVAPKPLANTREDALKPVGADAAGERPTSDQSAGSQPTLKSTIAQFAARRTRGDKLRFPSALANPTDSQLNLGGNDWTLECWLRLDADAGAEGTIFEIGTGPPGQNELVTRFSVLPRENAFALVGVSSSGDEKDGSIARRVEYANAEGPPVGVAYVRSTTLSLSGAAIPRHRWFHIALVHSATTKHLRLFIDGRQRTVVPVAIDALPHGNDAYVTVGRDGRGQRPLPGALDELRISEGVEYTADFPPPESFARSHKTPQPKPTR